MVTNQFRRVAWIMQLLRLITLVPKIPDFICNLFLKCCFLVTKMMTVILTRGPCAFSVWFAAASTTTRTPIVSWSCCRVSWRRRCSTGRTLNHKEPWSRSPRESSRRTRWLTSTVRNRTACGLLSRASRLCYADTGLLSRGQAARGILHEGLRRRPDAARWSRRQKAKGAFPLAFLGGIISKNNLSAVWTNINVWFRQITLRWTPLLWILKRFNAEVKKLTISRLTAFFLRHVKASKLSRGLFTLLLTFLFFIVYNTTLKNNNLHSHSLNWINVYFKKHNDSLHKCLTRI